MQRCFSGYKKKYPGNPPPDSKPNPIPNLTLTLPLTPQVGGGGSGRGDFPDTRI